MFRHEGHTTYKAVAQTRSRMYYVYRESGIVQKRKVEVVLMVCTILSAIQVENRSFVSLIFLGHTYLS